MKSFEGFPQNLKSTIGYVLTDIDDTLTIKGRLPSIAFAAMENLQKKGVSVIPITGRPAGWCDHIARMWPVDGVVGENGAFYFKYDDATKKMIRRYFKTEKERKEDWRKLEKIKQAIIKKISGCRVSADQSYREADLAIDFCEDVPPLSIKDIDRIATCFNEAGAQAKISSIHVNGWFGNYDKLTMTRLFFEEVFSVSLDQIKKRIIFTGDSPNDSPMFSYFPHSVGVANVLHYKERM
ncbi:MAG: HAD-IIB family hydrolase, partial [Deltaproteobacteria bacterium]|nr:HAD-IIB family hydrolase [Deltaproteobacteria bacterium]